MCVKGIKDCENKEFIHTFLRTCLEEEWKIPLLLQHFGMPAEEDNSSLQEVVEEKEEEIEETEEGTSHSEVYKFYKQNISSLSPYIVKELKEWIQKVSGKTVIEALKIAFEHNKRTLAYVKGILRNWCKKGRVDFIEGKEGVQKGEVCSLYDP